MQFDFRLRDVAGYVVVTVEPNADPAIVGTRSSARGFPVCAATVNYDARGYFAMLGWIQLVRSTDNQTAGREFEIDPYEPLGRTAHPFCWFGLTPTLLDAPPSPIGTGHVRMDRAKLSWVYRRSTSGVCDPRL